MSHQHHGRSLGAFLKAPWPSRPLAPGVPLKLCYAVSPNARKILRLLRPLRGLAEDEKILFARSLAATPDERWRLHENCLRSLGLFTRSKRKAYGFK